MEEKKSTKGAVKKSASAGKKTEAKTQKASAQTNKKASSAVKATAKKGAKVPAKSVTPKTATKAATAAKDAKLAAKNTKTSATKAAKATMPAKAKAKTATTKATSVKATSAKIEDVKKSKNAEKSTSKTAAATTSAKAKPQTSKAKAPANAAAKKSAEKTLAKPTTSAKATKTIKKNSTSKKAVHASTKAQPKVEDFTYEITQVLGYNNLPLHTLLFEKVPNPKAAVLIIHGMQEHCSRYENFAKFLNRNGYIVVASDLRGHGHTMKSKDDYGKGEKDIFKEALADQQKLLAFMKARYDLPIYVFGHSYGSFLTQVLIQQAPEIEKAVLCGTTNGAQPLFRLGNTLFASISPFTSKNKRGGMAEKMCITNFGKKFENGNWFTRDEGEFEKYKADELCGGSFPFSFYRSMMKNMTKANKNIARIGKKKLLLIAGSQDPVGANGEQVKKLYNIYLENNINAKLKLYEDARHELINEINKEEVFADILNFFNE